ncbi:hypothetical protein KL864_12395 [Mycolicibacterium goodii]|uniref:hypothetical protein n=1 Tax=Mycolicibacterium goodii TaxID=134601 RepID=UPI001BDCFA77|nr:hypothetical protein [Mycolicibacterium goodii]MBU8816703.1 hypothetical protein [Mycolicibacterium goodii]
MSYRWQQTMFQGYLVVSSIFSAKRRPRRPVPQTYDLSAPGVRAGDRHDERG